jgi:hypothetical protein
MIAQRLLTATRPIGRALAEWAREVQAWRERHRELFGEDAKEARGIKLLREWLSSEQRAEFDANRYFDVIGCDSGKRYRIRYGSAANVHEIDDDGRSLVGWCFVPTGNLFAGDVVLAQKIALETNEIGALAVANRFPVQVPREATRSRLAALGATS